MLIFSLGSVVAKLSAICDFSLNKSFKTYQGSMLPPGVRNWQLISPHCIYFGGNVERETVHPNLIIFRVLSKFFSKIKISPEANDITLFTVVIYATML